MLISLGGCEPQAKGHAAANLNVGKDRGVLLKSSRSSCPSSATPAA